MSTHFKTGDRVKVRPKYEEPLKNYGFSLETVYTVVRVLDEFGLSYLRLFGVAAQHYSICFEYYKASTAFVLNDEDV